MPDKAKNNIGYDVNAEAADPIQEKLDQYLADTFPCSDPLPQTLFADLSVEVPAMPVSMQAARN